MRTSPMLEFPVPEFEKRIGKLIAALKEKGLDGAIITSKENTRYFCGLQSIIWPSKVSTPGILFVSAGGGMKCVGSASATETARYTGCVEDEDVFHFDRNNIPGIPATYPSALAKAVRDLGLAGGKIGVETGRGTYFHLQVHWLEDLLNEVSFEMVDISDVIWKIRSIKSEAEIRILKDVYEINAKSIRYAFTNTKTDETTEAGLFRIYAQEAFRHHVENVLPMSVRYGKDRSDITDCPCSDEVVISSVPSQTVIVQGGLFKQGYYSDLTRVGVVGALSDIQIKMNEVRKNVQDYAVSVLKSGETVNAFKTKVDEFAAKEPALEFYKGCTGYGIGMDAVEYPILDEDADAVLQSNMLINICIVYGDKETGLLAVSEPIIVTDSGGVRLSGIEEDIMIL